MKRLISLAALCMTASLAFAQTTPPQPPREGDRMERLALLLDLDAGQKAAVETILTEQRQEMQAQRQAAKQSGTRPTREEMKAKFEAEHAATIEKLRPVLNDVQLKKFEALTDHPPGPPHGFGKRGDKPAAE
jgi:hypothetical protein